MTAEFKCGDTVRLVIGNTRGPPMLVEALGGTVGAAVLCIWFDRSRHVQQRMFYTRDLIHDVKQVT